MREAEGPRVRVKEELVVAAWNVQGMSLGQRGRVKARMVATRAKWHGWDVVLLSEVRADDEGVVWMGEEEERVVFVHGRKAAVLLRGDAMKKWVEGGMIWKVSEQHVSVKLMGVVLTASYIQPWVQGREEEIEEQFEVMGEHLKWVRKGEMPVFGGDFNGHVGRGVERRGVAGGFGLRGSTQQGEMLLEWCEERGLAHVSSFYQQRERGTWFSNLHRK